MPEDEREKLARHIQNCRDLLVIMKGEDHRKPIEVPIVFPDAMLADIDDQIVCIGSGSRFHYVATPPRPE